jgi:hypothetical protein
MAQMIAQMIAQSGGVPKGYLTIESGGVDFSGPLLWILILAALGGVGHLCYWLWTTKRKEMLKKRRQQEDLQHRSDLFQERAQNLGLRSGEARTVERIARRLAPKSPLNLLNSGQGRKYLQGDLERRIERRRKEVAVLERIVQRLDALRESDVHERETVRVDANIAVWVSRRGLSAPEIAALVEEEDEAEGAGVFANLDSVSGRLLDISEGGAAVHVDLQVARGEQVHIWSGDPRVILGETRAGVVDVKASDEGGSILYLHFIDPDLHDLRAAILQLRGEEEGDDE